MSTEGNVWLVKDGEMIVMGTLEGYTLHSPRVIVKTPEGRLMPVDLLGRPKKLQIAQNTTRWEVSDPELIRTYREEVSGLVLPSAGNNIVKMEVKK